MWNDAVSKCSVMMCVDEKLYFLLVLSVMRKMVESTSIYTHYKLNSTPAVKIVSLCASLK